MNKFTQFGNYNGIMPIIKPMVKRKIYSANGFYFSLAEHLYNEQTVSAIFRQTCTDVLNKYLQNINTYSVKDFEIYKENFDIIELDIQNTRLLRRFRRKFPDTDCMFRLESDRYIFWIKLSRYENTSSHEGSLCFIDKRKQFGAIGEVAVDTSSYDGIDTPIITSAFQNRFLFITSQRDKLSHKIAADNSDTMLLEQSFTLALNTGLHKIFDEEFDSDKFAGVCPTYDKTEMLIFHKIVVMFTIKNLICPLKEYINPDSPSDEDVHITGAEIPEYFGMGNTFKYFPLIQLNSKELKFIANYADKNVYVDGKTNLLKYLATPRYGNVLRIPVKYDNDSSEVVVTYHIDEIDNSVTFIISQHLEENLTYASMVYFQGLENFNINTCHIATASFLYMKDGKNMPISSDVFKDTVLHNQTSSDILSLVKQFIDICVAIHDRPERTKMVKCVRKEYYEKKNRNIKVDEKDYIVSRILKTKYDAREYVERMSGTRAECEYSVEEWDRCGHYRTLKSGKVIWIKETTCKRHLPLSEKEIRIKL